VAKWRLREDIVQHVENPGVDRTGKSAQQYGPFRHRFA
jgi:hypothetical protein